MKNTMALLLALSPALAMAIEADEVRDFDDVFSISASVTAPDRVEVVWKIETDYYLYNNRFLQFKAETPGVVLGEPDIPAGEKKFDELLGEEVIKFHDELRVGLPLVSVPPGTSLVELKIRSQGCLEAVLCYPPSWQTVAVNLPVAATGESLGSVLSAPASGLADSLLGDNRALAPELVSTQKPCWCVSPHSPVITCIGTSLNFAP
jgi:thiol:disulfide interchange protein DsbD